MALGDHKNNAKYVHFIARTIETRDTANRRNMEYEIMNQNGARVFHLTFWTGILSK